MFGVGRTMSKVGWDVMTKRYFSESAPDISIISKVLADQSRAAMCAALMNGNAWTVGELGRYVHLSRSTATEHVDKLVEAGIVHDVRQGRHRYIKLANSRTAEFIETLGALSPTPLPTPQSLHASRANSAVAQARTCYSHLAGVLGVRLCECFIDHDFITAHWQLTVQGAEFYRTWGVEHAEQLSLKPCLDCTERQFHMGGTLGVRICKQFFRHKWITRVKDSRAVKLTPGGKDMLTDLGVSLS